MSLTVTLCVLAVAVVVFGYGSWRAARPADPLKPRLIPWRFVSLFAGAVGLLMMAHVVNLFGIETGTNQPGR